MKGRRRVLWSKEGLVEGSVQHGKSCKSFFSNCVYHYNGGSWFLSPLAVRRKSPSAFRPVLLPPAWTQKEREREWVRECGQFDCPKIPHELCVCMYACVCVSVCMLCSFSLCLVLTQSINTFTGGWYREGKIEKCLLSNHPDRLRLFSALCSSLLSFFPSLTFFSLLFPFILLQSFYLCVCVCAREERKQMGQIGRYAHRCITWSPLAKTWLFIAYFNKGEEREREDKW